MLQLVVRKNAFQFRLGLRQLHSLIDLQPKFLHENGLNAASAQMMTMLNLISLQVIILT